MEKQRHKWLTLLGSCHLDNVRICAFPGWHSNIIGHFSWLNNCLLPSPVLKIVINLCLVFCSFSFIPSQTLRYSLHQRLCQAYWVLIDCLTNQAITKQDKVLSMYQGLSYYVLTTVQHQYAQEIFWPSKYEYSELYGM